MNQVINIKLVPKLRFPEFRNNSGWLLKTIAETCDILNNLRKPVTSTHRLKGKYPYYGASGIVDFVDDYIFNERLLLVGEDGAKWGSFENTAFIAEGKYWVNNHAHVLRTLEIIDILLENYLVMIDLSKYVTGAAPPKLTLGKLKEIPIPIPINKTEQQKIADCLSSLDDLITAETQKLDALKDHKKGLMQQLFPGEGEMEPKLRFEEFRGSGEWEELPLGKAAEIITGNTPPTNDTNNYGGERLFVSPADISNGRFITQTKTKLSEKGYSLTRRIKENSVLFVCIGSTIGKVAQNKYECATNQQINSLVPYEAYSSDFIYSALEFKASKIAAIAGNHAVPIINKSLFSSVLVGFPSFKEQEKIAKCLSTLDELISAQTEKIVELQKHKKGLMQGLFPVIKTK